MKKDDKDYDDCIKSFIPVCAMPEDFLKAFGFSFKDSIHKFELIFEAGEGKVAEVRVTFNQAPDMVGGAEAVAEHFKNYELVEKIN